MDELIRQIPVESGDHHSAWLDDSDLASIVRSHSEAIVVMSEDGTIVYANESVRATGWRPDEVIGRFGLDMIHPDDYDRAGVALAASRSSARPAAGMIRVITAKGEVRTFETSPGSFERADGRVFSFATLHDTRLNMAHWGAISELLAGVGTADALETMARGVSTDVDGPFGIAFDDRGERLTVGSLPPVMVGLREDGSLDERPESPFGVARPDDRAAVVRAVHQLPDDIREAATERGYGWAVVMAVADPGSDRPAFIVQWPPSAEMAALLANSIAVRPAELVRLALERRHQNERLEWLALHDPLTGLCNRARFIHAAENATEGGIVCYLDLDGFKEVNDSHGHVFGDQLLQVCADRLRAAARAEDVVARLGGDEFAVLCRPPLTDDHASRIGQRLVDALAEPVTIGGITVEIGASVGIAHLQPGADPDAAISAADRALYGVKRSGKGTWATV